MRSFLNKKIPTLAGLLFIVVTVFATSYLVHTGVIYFSGAAPTDNPENIRITNVSDTSFTITYVTQASVIGTANLSINGKTQTLLDDRDQESGIPQDYTIHSISLKNAQPQTSYSFSITSGATTYQNNENPFSITTAPTISSSPSAVTPLSGKLINLDGTVASNALVFVTTAGGQTLSALTNNQGIYIIPLNDLRTSNFGSQVSLTSNSILQILASNGPNESQAQVLLTNANPVPPMTLGNNYNFVTSTTPMASTSALGFPSFPENTNLTATPLIVTPQKNEGFTDSQPQFTGKALPNQTVTIQIHSTDVINATVQSDSNGNWTYRPNNPLSPGQHILSITTENANGILQTIQQSFTVYASGTSVNESATPSGQLSPTPTSTPTPTVAPTMGVTQTITPTSIPSPTITIRSTPKPTLPATGSNAVITFSSMGVVTAIVGVVLFVLTKGATL